MQGAATEISPQASSQRGSQAITNPSQDMPSHLLEAPRPRRPQDDQDNEQEIDLEPQPDEADQQKDEEKDVFPEEFDENLFRTKWAEVLERELSAKDREVNLLIQRALLNRDVI